LARYYSDIRYEERRVDASIILSGITPCSVSQA